MKIDNQMALGDVDAGYQAFVDKFKPKKTTDDCYTPESVYKAVLDWVVNEYGIDPNNIVRPFWPGGDYLREEYPEGCTVVDNPPFSIMTKICRDYMAAGVKFFLFAPYLTNFSGDVGGVCHIVTDARITYANGAAVNTAFLTNLDGCLIRSAPDLCRALEEANKVDTVRLPVYSYPGNVVTATRIGGLCRWGVDVRIWPAEATFVRRLDSQKTHGKVIFGSGYLVSDEAAQRVKAAEVKAAEVKAAEVKAAEVNNIWELSERERRIIEQLNKQGGTHGKEKETILGEEGPRRGPEAAHDPADPGGRAGDHEDRAQSRDPL